MESSFGDPCLQEEVQLMCNAAPENCSGAPLTRLPDWDRAKGATDRVPRKLSQNLRLQNSKENKK
uniref:Uncharacterized protein n=1 Tax=Tenebrio molitor TaxID=7067 RepID=A0A8J6L0G8_TENMO|nr:hypothetical protein GEV33_015497 [Tenebrio molitor]